MPIRNLDLGVLRTFLLIAEGRSFLEAAETVGRSPSAVSLQIRRLEEELGVQVLRRSNREVALTLAGERLLGFARRMVRANDEAVEAFRRPSEPSRPIRFGTTQDFAEAALPDLLRRFSREHPGAELVLRVDRSARLVEALHAGELDAAIAVRRDDPLALGTIAELPMLWIGREGAAPPEPGAPVALALFDPPCSFRSAAIEALAAAGRGHRVAFTSPSLSGLRSAAEAGIGLTVRTRLLLGPGLADLGEAFGLPPLPRVAFALYAGAGAGAGEGPWPARDDLLELSRRALA